MKNKSILPYISKPGRYLGHEYNTIQKDWNSNAVHFALIFPDVYEIGMSHLGLQILYHILNNQNDVLAERSYCPDLDAEKIMSQRDLPLLTLESARPVSSFDIIGITLPYELCYTNILTVLHLSDIPFHASERDDSHPIILGGGSCSLNPEPVADFFDAILLGDGEEGVVDVADVMKRAKSTGMKRKDIITELAKLSGVYIPSHFAPQYNDDNTIKEIVHSSGSYKQVERRVIENLDATSHLLRPLVPNAKIVHDRLGVEIARGCTRGCRFCQAGMIYRPVRERDINTIMGLAKDGIDHSGFEEMALLSLSTGDYSCINQLLPQLMDTFAEDYVSVSLPSMRVGTLSQQVMDQIKRVRKTGFTVAPEAGSERLRQVINKGISEDDLLRTCGDAFTLGWSAIKLYFMIGLPTETLEDVAEIGHLTAKTLKVANSVGGKRKQITTNVGTFVPKPHTPFQWEEQISLEESYARIHHLKENMVRKGAKLKYHDPKMSFLEGVFSRGDRRLSNVIETAWQSGSRLDGWSEHFHLERWLQAADDCSINFDEYLRRRTQDEILPWHHLSSGIDTTFFQEELEKAHKTVYTPDCRYHGCQKCGLCDFKKIKPVVHTNSSEPDQADHYPGSPAAGKTDQDTTHFKYMVSYSRVGDICYLGHLEILQLLFRAIRRAKIKTNFSKGFNPSPKISFGGALPVGMESQAEFFIMDLPTPLTDENKSITLLNDALPDGLTIMEIKLHNGVIPQKVINVYEIKCPRELTKTEQTSLQNFCRSDDSTISRTRKGKTKKLNIRPLVHEIRQTGPSVIHLELISSVGEPGVKVTELLQHLFSWEEEIYHCKICKCASTPLEDS